MWLAGGLLMALQLVFGADWARADEHGGHRRHGRRHDHDVARRALTGGLIRPLADVLAEVHASTPGDVVSIELERDDGRWEYHIKVIGPDGNLRKLTIDARRRPASQLDAAPVRAGRNAGEPKAKPGATAGQPVPPMSKAPADRPAAKGGR